MSRSHAPAHRTDASLDATLPAGTLSRVLDAAAAAADECLLRFRDGGLDVAARDPADVVLLDLQVGESAFDSLRGDATLGLDVDRLGEVAAMADDDDAVGLVLDGRGRLGVSTAALEYSLAPLAPESVRDAPDLDVDHAATVTLDRSTLDRAVRAGAMVAETATLSVDPDAPALVVAASGDTDEVRVELGPDDVASLDPAPAGALFSLSYLDRVLGGMPRDATVTLACGDDRPLALSFEFADSGTATFLVAPRTPLDR